MRMEIPKTEELEDQVFSISDTADFIQTALSVFRLQYYNNSIYHAYCNLLKSTPDTINDLSQIPFLPISFFKTHTVVTTSFEPAVTFESSGTTGIATSRHYIKDIKLYERSFRTAFQHFYGPVEQYCVLGLLPSYLERSSSSLVYMVNDLIEKSNHPQSGFYLYDYQSLADTLEKLEAAGQKTLLIGVTYALLDFAEQYPMPLQHTLVMETGGMKGRKKELLRSEVHAQLKKSFALPQIHSEYGMTELLSQAYAMEEGYFKTPAWMKILIREEDDPLSSDTNSTSGGINIIDLANLYSCAFIATEDIGRLHPDGYFEVLGRLDNADVRGCSLLVV
jgi:hypothetical protein